MAVERATKRRRLSPPVEEVPGFAKVDLEQDYQQRLRKKQQKSKDKDRLPVKKEAAWVGDERHQAADEAPSESEQDEDEEEAKDSGVADVQPKRKVKPRPTLPPKEEIRQAKEELARIAGLVSESPEEHVGQLGALAELSESENITVKKLALGTQLAVYKDIVPGYRIRPLSKDDLQAKLSKDVRKLRNFEQGLLGGYKDYVHMLDRLAKNDKGSTDPSLVSVAISCVRALLANVAHFNCRNELIGILVRKLSGRTVDADFVKCREAMEQLFRDDDEGHASLEAVKQLTIMMKEKNYRTDEAVLNTFLHLRLLSEFAHKASTNKVDKDEDEDDSKGKKQKRPKKEFRTKRERKVMKERKEVEKEMKEADATVSYEERDKNQAETLKLVFVAYFRILKARKQHLMGAVLEGLAKYAHLINQDFFGDILEALKDLINDAENNETSVEDDDTPTNRNISRESLLCIITAFALLQGQTDVVKSANTLHLDLNFFITHLYRNLLPLSMDSDVELSSKPSHLEDPNGLPVPTTTSKDTRVNVSTTTVLLLRSLQSALLPANATTRSVPPTRVAAFVKQLHTAALHLPQKSAVAVMGLLNQVAKIHGKKIAALWFTEERKGDGVFDALGPEVEASNPFAGTVWEGELLKLHFDPRVREGVKGVEGHIVEAR
ncbi:uncharacterized protein LTR77_001912 [Saxophila tyrrhenica]|uniref:Nucleolar complex-associated protein 3 n=1 Tax=Saxophila tyrrhenica TaxID=1690608 RepID=A0AAV9PRA7_9PEZI|nr:hypothetical protein LTR77_001912 [Saxophila tyrrhenica]